MSKVARNLQEQVEKNMEDIELLKKYKGYLGPFDSVADIPEEAKSQYWLYLVGDEAPYELYKFDGTNFVDLGEFPRKGDKGDTGSTGADGTPAGFGTPTAQATGLQPNQNPTVTVTASGSNTEKVFAFQFGIPKGEKGDQGPAGPVSTAYYYHRIDMYAHDNVTIGNESKLIYPYISAEFTNLDDTGIYSVQDLYNYVMAGKILNLKVTGYDSSTYPFIPMRLDLIDNTTYGYGIHLEFYAQNPTTQELEKKYLDFFENNSTLQVSPIPVVVKLDY